MRLGVLGSTRGTNLLPILSAIEQKVLPVTIATVISNKQDALILKRAEEAGLPAHFINPAQLNREEFDAIVSDTLKQYDVDLVVLIGYMRILSGAFTKAWQGKIINVHPSLLPAFAGMMDLTVHEAVLAAKVKETGCTVHYVTEIVDAGPMILQKKCVVNQEDTPELLKQRVQALEGQALIDAIYSLQSRRK